MDHHNETEIEVTIDLDKESYIKFCNLMESSLIDVYDQWNIFFDTVDHSLVNSGKRCRVRSIDALKSENKYTITSKTSMSDIIEGAVAIRREIERNITKEEFESIMSKPEDYYKLAPEAIQNELNDFKDKPFMFFVDFRSIRRMYKVGEFVVESDECTLPNGEQFYQLEVESSKPDEAKMALENKLNEIGVNFTEANFGKYTKLLAIPKDQRFSERLRKQIDKNKA